MLLQARLEHMCIAVDNCSVSLLCCTLCHPQASCGHTAAVLQLTCGNQLQVLLVLPEAHCSKLQLTSWNLLQALLGAQAMQCRAFRACALGFLLPHCQLMDTWTLQVLLGAHGRCRVQPLPGTPP